MMHILPRIIVALSALCVLGCGTVNNLSVGTPMASGGTYNAPQLVYGGTVDSAQDGWKHLSQPREWIHPVAGLYLMAVDTPLSLVADTLTLPITVPAAIDRAVEDYYFPDGHEQSESANDLTD